MHIENEFAVAQPVDALWAHLLEVERIAPCLPGAEITETVDDRTWKGKVNVKFGPVALAFSGTVTIQERDDGAHRVVLAAKGMEQKGKGAATANVTSWLEPRDDATLVKIQSDITLSGAVAQLSRGLLPEVSRKMTQEFADCLQASIGSAATSGGSSSGSSAPAGSDPIGRPAVAPVRGFRLGLAALWAMIRDVFVRLFGRR